MVDREGMSAATGVASLGMLADDALIAIVRYQEGRTLQPREREALTRASELIGAVGELGKREIVATSGLRAMSSIGVLDETFQALTGATPDASTTDFADAMTQLQRTISALLEDRAESSALDALRLFFDRLGSITLARSEEVARPSREHRGKWIREALS